MEEKNSLIISFPIPLSSQFTHTLTHSPFPRLTLAPYSPDRKNKTHMWGLKSFFKADRFSVKLKMWTIFSNYSILLFSS